MTDRALLTAASRVDVLNLAASIVDAPRRNAVSASAADTVALAHAVHRFWPIVDAADRLASLTIADQDAPTRAFCADLIITQTAALRGEIQEPSNV